MFTYTPVTNTYKIRNHFKECKNEPLIIQQGSQGASKTVSDLMLIIDFFRNDPNREITICSAEKTKLMDTAFNDLKKICIDWGIWEEFKWNDNKSKLSKNNFTGFIEFIGLDKDDIGKGRRRDLIYINECNKVSKSKFFDITQRAKKVVVDFNPDSSFYIHDLINDKNFIKLDFTGNEKLPIQEKRNILSWKALGYKLNDDGSFFLDDKKQRVILNEFYANKWRVYGEGEIGSVEGRIYYWNKIPLQQYQEIKRPVYYGVDWGNVDPFAVVEVKYSDGCLYCRQINYQSENKIRQTLTTSQIANIDGQEEGLVPYLFKQWGIKYDSLIVCDNNRPTKILSLRNNGWEYAVGVGGKSKLIDRIGALQNLKIFYTDDSKDIDFEQMNYCYGKDRNGNSLESPMDLNNHTIDAISYIVQKLFDEGIINSL